MAMIRCRECGKEISDKAPTCPYCGCPSEEESQYRKLKSGNERSKSVWNALGGGVLGSISAFLLARLAGFNYYGAFTAGLLGFCIILIIGLIALAVQAGSSTKRKQPKENEALIRDRKRIILVSLVGGIVVFAVVYAFASIEVALVVGAIALCGVEFSLLGVSEHRIKNGESGIFDDDE